MSSIWAGKVVAFNPFIVNNQLKGFAIASKDSRFFYGESANYNSLLSEAKEVIVFDSNALQKVLKDWNFFKHNLRTLYFQLNPDTRFQTLADLVKNEYYTIDPDSFVYTVKREEGHRQCVKEACFMLDFYKKNYKKADKDILKLDNSLLNKVSQENTIEINEVEIRTSLSMYSLKIWTLERKIFKIVGYPVMALSQIDFKNRTDELEELFSEKNKLKLKYENLLPYFKRENLTLNLDITGTSTGRILCRDVSNRNTLFSPDNEYKQNFCAPLNQTFVSADYSKQEAVILSCISKDERLAKDLTHNNYYALLAKTLIGEKSKKLGKTLFYSWLYGASNKVLASSLGVSEVEAKDIKQGLLERYRTTNKWIKQQDFTHNYFGRLLHANTVNAYIQSTAADIVRQKLLQTSQFNPICVFSDNIIYQVDEDTVEQSAQLIKYILEDVKGFNLSTVVNINKNFNFS